MGRRKAVRLLKASNRLYLLAKSIASPSMPRMLEMVPSLAESAVLPAGNHPSESYGHFFKFTFNSRAYSFSLKITLDAATWTLILMTMATELSAFTTLSKTPASTH